MSLLSENGSDGFVLLYIKDSKLKPVIVTSDMRTELESVIGNMVERNPIRILDPEEV